MDLPARACGPQFGSVIEFPNTREQDMGIELEAMTGVDDGAITEEDEGGFSAQLDGVTLWDLVQLECLAGSRKAVRVRSGSRLGYLFFERGHLVHAIQGSSEGDAAALSILAWSRGEVVPCELTWPRRRTVQTSWQSLLMQAAQQRDEQGADAPPGQPPGGLGRNSGVLVIESSQDSGVPAAAPGGRVEVSPMDEAEDDDPEPELELVDEEDMDAGGFAHLPARLGCAARLDPGGELTEVLGDGEPLAGQAAYAMRLGDLMGEILALGATSALEVPARAGAQTAAPVLACRDAEGGLLAVTPADAADAPALRRALGL
jgi:hypothetical protein